ncbi:MAG: DUF3322 and DUF2220 domain-containing protein [Actinobacteria bacterium]|nr:DUF3322 and DUF2220 domain-containing protein [Actinomycetota bacterium]
MRTVDDARRRVKTWLDRNATAKVANGDTTGLVVGLDAPSGPTLRQQWDAARDWALTWRRDEAGLPDGVAVEWTVRLLGASRQEMPTRLLVATLDAASWFVGGGYPAQLAGVRGRWAVLSAAFPLAADTGTLRAVQPMPQVDFDLLLSTARWFAEHPVPDNTWTPRQVPVPGLHAKWLDAPGRRALIARLTGLPDIRLLARPLQTRVTYLDPAHARTGGRRWDIVTAGDVPALPYPPRTVLVVENRDTAFFFPPVVPHGLAVLGNGDAVVTLIVNIRPLVDADTLLYWGDIDAEGLRIISRLRGRGHPVRTILMDTPAYQAYARFGTNTDQHGRPIAPGDPTPPPGLTDDETALYRLLTDPAWDGPRRVEQERIPLPVAVDALRVAVDAAAAPSTRNT